MSMPAGFTADGLPVGLELLGGAFSEPLLLRVAYAYERVRAPSASARERAVALQADGLRRLEDLRL